MAFGRLKARWRRLGKKIDMFVGNVPNVILACCILHNICEVHGGVFNDEWIEESELTQPDAVTTSTSTTDGGTVRDLLVNYFETIKFFVYMTFKWYRCIHYIIMLLKTHTHKSP